MAEWSELTSRSDSRPTATAETVRTVSASQLDHAATSSRVGAWNRCACVMFVNASAARYSDMRTTATKTLTVSRALASTGEPRTSIAGRTRPATAMKSDDEWTLAARGLKLMLL